MTSEASQARVSSPETNRRYRYRTAVLVGRWRRSRDLAIEDAIVAKQARREAGDPSGLKWIVPGQIEESEG